MSESEPTMPLAPSPRRTGAFSVAVTFEAPTRRPPETVRLRIDAYSASTAASRAVRLAQRQRQNPRLHWDDILVLIERAPSPQQEPRS